MSRQPQSHSSHQLQPEADKDILDDRVESMICNAEENRAKIFGTPGRKKSFIDYDHVINFHQPGVNLWKLI